MKLPHTPLIIGNWKMNPGTLVAAQRLYKEVQKGVARISDVDVAVAPPAIFLGALAQNTKKSLELASQDIYFEKLGAHTGEDSILMVKSLGAKYVIVGHSERRVKGETDEDVNKKVHTILKEGCVAIACVGEQKRDHSGNYLTHIEKQVHGLCAGVSKAKLNSLVIAYEPIWAIGTGKNATPEDAHEMKLFIQRVLTDMYGRNFASKVRILYGGSVNAKNAGELMEQGTVDGFLVGGASLRSNEFVNIVKIVHEGLT